ncbi:type I-U CRISPR-associated protein Cas5/Cas6 [Enemella evansiae]|uniref:type I-G CRISPR-associated protein Csb2 n=1 Tax=Enemella evansiae TaxID=2016499 RepID=UPI000B969C7E|nr:type I-U CRISPR-associated protein Csb2 [Enemella evansiae]OYO00503.1 type I-U CRISPR-associated protein Cas5/Cas6 [Enemella evansiae]
MLSLVAEYPLGTYAGRTRDATPEQFPTPDRLLAALLAAAGGGAYAQVVDGQLAPRPEDIMLLEWLEQNPPDRIHLPALATNAGAAVAYRRQGLTGGKNGIAAPQGASAVLRTAMDGAVAWQWSEFPEELKQTLIELVSEVSYIGPAESPTVVTLRTDTPDGANRLLVRDPAPDPFSTTVGSVELPVPRSGRTRALVDDYIKRLSKPSAAADKVKSTEDNLVDSWLSDHLGSEIYRTEDRIDARLPWTDVHVLQVRPIRSAARLTMSDSVRVAVAAHRAIVGILGAGGTNVDSWITGRFLDGVPRPANRMAIQYLPRSTSAALGWHDEATAALLVLLPRDLPGNVGASISAALQTLQRNGLNVSRREGFEVLTSSRQDCETFWRTPGEGMKRLWSPAPVAIVERRRRRASLADAMATSLAMVWRDLRENDANEWGRVLRAKKVSGPGLDRFVHRMNPEAALVAYHALADLSGLMPDTALVALGQSRHLGTGLLVPVDVPTSEWEALNNADH